jgi:hypothetical protein
MSSPLQNIETAVSIRCNKDALWASVVSSSHRETSDLAAYNLLEIRSTAIPQMSITLHSCDVS